MIKTFFTRTLIRQQQQQRAFSTISRHLQQSSSNASYESEYPDEVESGENSKNKTFRLRSTVNKAIICGRVGAPPNVKFSTETNSNGTSENNQPPKKGFGILTLATSDPYLKDAQGKSAVSWHNIVTFHPSIISIMSKYVRKGMLVYVEGPIIQKQHKDKEGNNRVVTQILVREPSDFRILEGNIEDFNGGSGNQQQQQ